MYTLTGFKKKFRHIGSAVNQARKLHPFIVWGDWHQGPNGNMRLVGKLRDKETSDPIIIEYQSKQ